MCMYHIIKDGGQKFYCIKSFSVFLKFQTHDKWSECRELKRNGRVNLQRNRPADDFFYCFGCPYNILVIMVDWTTANMDPSE